MVSVCLEIIKIAVSASPPVDLNLCLYATCPKNILDKTGDRVMPNLRQNRLTGPGGDVEYVPPGKVVYSVVVSQRFQISTCMLLQDRPQRCVHIHMVGRAELQLPFRIQPREVT